jgi:hypothetical protein
MNTLKAIMLGLGLSLAAPTFMPAETGLQTVEAKRRRKLPRKKKAKKKPAKKATVKAPPKNTNCNPSVAEEFFNKKDAFNLTYCLKQTVNNSQQSESNIILRYVNGLVQKDIDIGNTEFMYIREAILKDWKNTRNQLDYVILLDLLKNGKAKNPDGKSYNSFLFNSDMSAELYNCVDSCEPYASAMALDIISDVYGVSEEFIKKGLVKAQSAEQVQKYLDLLVKSNNRLPGKDVAKLIMDADPSTMPAYVNHVFEYGQTDDHKQLTRAIYHWTRLIMENKGKRVGDNEQLESLNRMYAFVNACNSASEKHEKPEAKDAAAAYVTAIAPSTVAGLTELLYSDEAGPVSALNAKVMHALQPSDKTLKAILVQRGYGSLYK